jgi:hypothetical protein
MLSASIPGVFADYPAPSAANDNAQKSPAREIEFSKPHQAGYRVQDLRAKINLFRFSENHVSLSPFRAGVRGVSRSSRAWCGMRWTGMGRLTTGIISVRRNCVVLSPRRWRQVGGDADASRRRRWQTSIGSPRRAPISRKPSRREGRCDHRRTCGSRARANFFCACSPGCCGHPAFPAPSPISEGT